MIDVNRSDQWVALEAFLIRHLILRSLWVGAGATTRLR